MSDPILIPDMLTATLGFAVFLLGARLTRKFALLREFNIPEPVTGGLLAALGFAAVSYVLGRDFEFSLASRDFFLILFFT